MVISRQSDVTVSMATNMIDDKCVRCGACLSVCPVYEATLKERFSPRGKNYLIHASGIDRGQGLVRETIKACLQCGACSAVCTSGADVCALIRSQRAVHRFFRTLPYPVYNLFSHQNLAKFAIKAADLIPSSDKVGKSDTGSLKTIFQGYKSATKFLGRHNPPFLASPSEWTRRYLEKARHIEFKEPVPQIAFFVGCSQNMLFSQVAAKVSAIFNGQISIPVDQVCCGLPAFSAGATGYVKRAISKNLEALENEEFDILLTACASCASMIKKWPQVFEKGSKEWHRASAISEKVMEFSQAALEFLRPANCTAGRIVSFQMPCHQRYDLSKGDDPLRLLERNLGKGFRYGQSGCCGQGGLFGFARPDLSAQIFKKTIASIGEDVRLLTTTCSGCLLRLKIGLSGHIADKRNTLACHVVDTIVPD